jgi:hypothetical protein
VRLKRENQVAPAPMLGTDLTLSVPPFLGEFRGNESGAGPRAEVAN